jgi:hypothetical protein
MTITITLAPDTEKKLLEVAAASGIAPDALAQKLIERGLNGGTGQPSSAQDGKSWDEILAPFRREVEESGRTDELREFFTEARDEARAARRARGGAGPE